MKHKICKEEKEVKKVKNSFKDISDKEFSPKLQSIFNVINNLRERNAKDLLTMEEKIRIESLLKELEEKKPEERSKLMDSLSIEDEILLLEIINAKGILISERAISKG